MKGKASGELNGFLDRGASFKGEMEFEDTMRIDGKFNGKIMSKNELIVGESAHIDTLDPEFDGMPIVRKRIDDARIDTVLSNSFGFGGTNATLVFQRYDA